MRPLPKLGQAEMALETTTAKTRKPRARRKTG
jgi:hypothetical protein